MNKKSLAVVALSVLALTACGQNASDSPSESASESAEAKPVKAPSVAPVETPSPEPTEEESLTNDRGNFESEIGNVGELSTAEGVAVTFTVDSIEPSVCTEELTDPIENGFLYTVALTVEATKALGDSEVPTNPAAFTFISEDGTTFNGELGSYAAYSCISEQESLPGYVGPGEKATGKLVVDVPAESGTLIFHPTYGHTESFEYKF